MPHRGYVEHVNAVSVKGWCLAPEHPEESVTLQINLNGKELARGRAEIFRLDLLKAGVGTGHHGFYIGVPNLVATEDVEVNPLGSAIPLERLVNETSRRSKNSRQRAAGHIVPGQEVTQIFVAGADYLSSLSLFMGTCGRVLTSSSISFSLFKISGKGSERSEIQSILSMTERAEALHDNEHFDLFFSPDPNSKGEVFLLKISSNDATVDNAATIWLHNGPPRIAGHSGCFVGGRNQDDFGVVADVGYSRPTSNTAVPEHILYSPVTQCNLNCVHCISRETRTGAHRLSDDVRDKIRTWCRNGLIKYIYTDYSGDILYADHRWGGEIAFLIDLDVPFHVCTNGVYLTVERGTKLLQSKMTSLNVSLDAADPETYKRIRKGSAPLASVLENVAHFSRLRDAENANARLLLSLSFTLMRSNIDQLNDFIEIGARVGVDRIECRHVEAYTPDMAEESLWFSKDRFNEARLAAIDLAAKLGVTLGIGAPLEERPSRAGHRFCMAPWTTSVILGNGDVQVCCLPKTKIGNLLEQTMEQIWNGDRYAEFRTKVNSDTAPASCKACAFMRRPGNELSFLPYLTIREWVPPCEWQKSAPTVGESGRH